MRYPEIELEHQLHEKTKLRVRVPLPGMTKGHWIRAGRQAAEAVYGMVLAAADSGKHGTPSADDKLFFQRIVADLQRETDIAFGVGASPDAPVRSMDEIAADLEKQDFPALDGEAESLPPPVQETEPVASESAPPGDEETIPADIDEHPMASVAVSSPPTAVSPSVVSPVSVLPAPAASQPVVSVPAPASPVAVHVTTPVPAPMQPPVVRMNIQSSIPADADPDDEGEGPAGASDEDEGTSPPPSVPQTVSSATSMPAVPATPPSVVSPAVTPTVSSDPSKQSLDVIQWTDIRKALMAMGRDHPLYIGARECQKAMSFMAGIFKEISFGKETIPDDVIRTARYNDWELEAEIIARHISWKTASHSILKLRSLRQAATSAKPSASVAPGAA